MMCLATYGALFGVLLCGTLREPPPVVRTARCDPRLGPGDMLCCLRLMLTLVHLAWLLISSAAGVTERKDGRDLPRFQLHQRSLSWRSTTASVGLISCALS